MRREREIDREWRQRIRGRTVESRDRGGRE